MDSIRSSRAAIFIIFIMIFTPWSPVFSNVVDDVQAAGVARHIYDFKDGSSEYIALYQGGNPDVGAEIQIPKGALVTDVSLTLSGASATGWSQIVTDERKDWVKGLESLIDDRSDDLTLAMSNTTILFDPHGNDAVEDPNSDAWLDNGSFSLRQPHTSNATESRFSQQVSKTATTFMAQGQGAILKHHDWLFLSTWSSSSFHNVVKRLYPNNATIESTITLDKAQCTLPQKHSSSYYGMYGFRDWTLTDDERLFGILSGYKYPYGSTAPVMYHRVVEMDVSRDDVWTCIDSYDVSPQLQDYVAIAYDHSRDVVWIVHNSARSIVPYTFSGDGTGQYQRGDTMYTFSSSSGSSWDCGRTGQLVRGLEVNQSTFFMRCQKDQYYNDRDQLEAWSISGQSSSLVPQQGVRQISPLGYGLQFDGKRFVTVDSGYSTWSGSTLYYREFGTGWTYKTTPAPGTTTWYGPVVNSGDDILSANMKAYWSASSIGDRVDYWISADNGTHWEPVVSNETIHFAYPGKELVWKAQLIGSTAVSWWVELEYATEYQPSGDWTSPHFNTGTKVGKVRPVWVADEPAGTSISVMVSNDNGTNWVQAPNNQESSFSTEGAGNTLKYAIFFTTNDATITPKIDKFTLNFEEGYPDRPEIDVGNDGTWDWRSLLFLNESSIVANDESAVGTVVRDAPTLIDAFNDFIPENGEGTVNVPIAIKAATSGRVKISNIDVAYKMQTRAVSVEFEGGLTAPDGIYRNLIATVAHGDDVDRVTKATIGILNSHGPTPSFMWQLGNSCSTISNAGGIIQFDTTNCTSSINSKGELVIRIPTKVNWSWNDESDAEAVVTVEDSLGIAVNGWQTSDMDLVIENDIQLDGLRVFEETGRELYSFDWVRGGYNLTFVGGIYFESSQLMPEAGSFSIRIIGQNVTYDGDPVGEPVVLLEEVNPAFGEYNFTFTSPTESHPGGMVFYVQAVDLVNGSTFSNPSYNSIRLVLDGNSPLVIQATPIDRSEQHAAATGGGKPISITIQDSVDPPNTISLHYWIGCRASDAIGCTDYNFDGLPNADEYELMSIGSPDTQVGGLNIFEGMLDDSMLLHGQKVSFYVSGKDGQNNQVAMGGGPVCPQSSVSCGYRPGETVPDWDADLVTYVIRQEFQPSVDIGNSTIVGHDDYQPLHPGILYTAQLVVSDRNTWRDIQYIQLSLSGDLEDDESSIFISMEEDENGQPRAVMASGSTHIAVSNIYSTVEIDPVNESKILIQARFQLTWTFPEIFDTNGESHFIPKILITDRPCNVGEDTPCYELEYGLGEDWWSLDNDFRFDTESGHIRAVELRNGLNHYNDENFETIIGAGQALRVSGRVLFSEDETPAPAGAFDVTFGDFEFLWETSTRLDGEFSLDLLVPSVRSGHLDLRLKLDDLPGLAEDQSPFVPRVRLAVDSDRPTIGSISLGGVDPNMPLSIGNADNLLVQLETRDDNGFDFDKPAVLHYRVKAGEAEISRGSVLLPEITPFGDQFFWTGYLDLTDAGATTLLQSYMVDVWISGSDEAGNPFDTSGNSMIEPFASWPLALIGPKVDLQAESTSLKWSNPSPTQGQLSSMIVKGTNLGGSGQIEFSLQRLIEGGFWSETDVISLDVTTNQDFIATLSDIADVAAGESIQYRVLVLVDGVEMDRVTVDPLIVKEQTIRDGDALSQQASEGTFSIVLFIIALGSISFGVWSMVMRRRLIAESFEDESDQTADVVDAMEDNDKIVPEIENAPQPPTIPPPQTAPVVPAPMPAAPPVPPTGLPEGWTMEQWNAYGWQYLNSKK